MRKSYQRILCAIDFSDYTQLVLSYALKMAKIFDAKLLVCHVVDLRSTAMYGEAAIDLMEQRNQVIDYITAQMSDLFGDHSIPYEPLIVFGRPAHKITQLAYEKKADLVITATRGRSGLKRIVMGSVTEKLMKTLSCSLLVINSPKSQVPSDTPWFKGFKKILIGCDFSDESLRALIYGLELSKQFNARVTLAHVRAPSSGKESKEGTPDDEVKSENQIEDEMKSWVLRETKEPLSAQMAIIEGNSDTALNQYAEEKACDLMVIGVRESGVFKSFFLGSTVNRVIREAACPILLIQSEAEERRKSAQAAPLSSDDINVYPTISDMAFFSIKYQEQSAIITFKDNLLFHATDLHARDLLFEHLNNIEKDGEIKTLIILGAHDKSGQEEYVDFFSFILDSKLDTNAIHRLLNSVDQFILRMMEFNKVVIHADCGRVISLFLNLSLACDFRIIADDTLFQSPYLELGMIPKGGGAYFLSKMLGAAKAMKILSTKTRMSAMEAFEMGLVDLVVPMDQLKASAIRFASQFDTRSISTMSGIKRLVQYAYGDVRQYLELENQEILKLIGSPIRDSAFWRNIRNYRQET